MTPTEISNLALSALPAGAITSLDENSIQARACKLWYQQTLGELLEMGPWRFQIKREALAAWEFNDREGHWRYSFTPPSGAAWVIQVLDSGDCPQPYLFEGDLIYTNAPDAQVDYVSNDPSKLATTARARFRGALIAMLAARICMPITKSSKRERELITIAETATTRAQAANHNENPATYGDHIPDILKGRAGGLISNRRLEGPEVVYPDFDPVGVFEGELD